MAKRSGYARNTIGNLGVDIMKPRGIPSTSQMDRAIKAVELRGIKKLVCPVCGKDYILSNETDVMNTEKTAHLTRTIYMHWIEPFGEIKEEHTATGCFKDVLPVEP